MLHISEYVSPGHPDKIADYISSYLLDRYIERDPATRYAVEVQIKNSRVTLGGEISSKCRFRLHPCIPQSVGCREHYMRRPAHGREPHNTTVPRHRTGVAGLGRPRHLLRSCLISASNGLHAYGLHSRPSAQQGSVRERHRWSRHQDAGCLERRCSRESDCGHSSAR